MQALDQAAVELGHAVDVDAVDEAVGGGVDDGDLVLDRQRRALALVERLHEPLAAGQRALGLGIEVGAELGEGLEVAVLRQLDLQLAGHLAHRRDLRVAAHARHRDADVDGRAHAGVEEAGLEEDLPVGDRDDVGRDVGRHVAGLRLDDRQRRQRAAAEVVVELDRALEQARVQVEDVAGVGLAPGRAAQQQRHLAVGVRVLGEVVVDDQRVPAVVEEVLGHRAAGVRRHVLDRRGLVGRRGDDDRVVERVGVLEDPRDADHGRHALADRHVDRDDARCPCC